MCYFFLCARGVPALDNDDMLQSRRSSAEERGICNPQVVGSNPTGGSILKILPHDRKGLPLQGFTFLEGTIYRLDALKTPNKNVR